MIKGKTVICLTPLGMDWSELLQKKLVVNFNETIFSQFEKEEMDTFLYYFKKD